MATGVGGTTLADVSNAVVVSIGTGTSLVLVRDGGCAHIGGSGVGSGTLRGLSRKMFGRQDTRELFKLSESGNRLTVDLTVGDLFSGTDTLPPDLTASNLAKAADGASEEDWAMAVVNMTPTSLVPQMAQAEGKSFGELCEEIIAVSMKKYQ